MYMVNIPERVKERIMPVIGESLLGVSFCYAMNAIMAHIGQNREEVAASFFIVMASGLAGAGISATVGPLESDRIK